jgi:hypothetical protein
VGAIKIWRNIGMDIDRGCYGADVCIRGTYGVRYLSTGHSVTSVDIVYQVSVLRHIFE